MQRLYINIIIRWPTASTINLHIFSSFTIVFVFETTTIFTFNYSFN